MAVPAVDWAINKLDLLLTREVKLQRHVHKELRDLKDELEIIKSFLKDADARYYRQDEDSRVKIWVKQVRQVAFRMEDVVDKYMLQVVAHQDRVGNLPKIPIFVKKLKARRVIASEIEDIKISVGQIKERFDRYNFNFLSRKVSSECHNTWHDSLRMSSLFVDEAQLVGMESPKAELMSKLIEGTNKNSVVTVVGMGGLGKTTLAKNVYDSECVNAGFDCKAWITVSQSYSIEKLLRSLMVQFLRSQTVPTMEGIDELIEKLRQYLSDKRYVVVFDDVWRIDLWRYVKNVLPENGKRNRIIITTRNGGVAPSPNESPYYHIYKLQPLTETKAHELFCKMVFKSSGGNCPLELQDWSRRIIDKCEGLPLAIVTICGVLATKKKTLSEWKNFYDGLSYSLESDHHLSNIATILSLSYNDLPYYLKSCFLYLGTFPEDYYIESKRLIRKWIAEGFVKGRQGKTLEDVAEEYLMELKGSSLVEAAKIDIDGNIERCTVHDLIRGIILSRAKELNFHQISIDNFVSLQGIWRHLSIDDSIENSLEGSNVDSQTHSITLFRVNQLPKSVVISFCINFKFLRELDFEGTPLDFVPEQVGNLWFLRLLSLRKSNVKTLPKAIGKLCNLETLDVSESKVRELPFEINRLQKLRHFLAYFLNYSDNWNQNTVSGLKIHGNIGCVKSLQTLVAIEVHDDVDFFRQFERLTQLRYVTINNLKGESGLALCSALEKMTCLNTLTVSSEVLDLQSICHPPPLLKYLLLIGSLVNSKLPQWISKLIDLVSIKLYWSRLENDALQVLHALPHLAELQIYKGYDGKQLHFRKGCFQKLKVLRPRNLIELNELMIEEEALPVVEELSLGPLPELKELPSGIRFLKTLKKLEFMDIKAEFPIRMQRDGGQDYWIVEHIPLVLFWYKTTGLRYGFYKRDDSEQQ